MAVYNPKPKNGRTRERRSFIVYTDTVDKFLYIAKVSGVQSSELMEQVLSQTVGAWEQLHGEIKPASTETPVDLLSAIERAAATEPLKRGNPHPTGRKPKNQSRE